MEHVGSFEVMVHNKKNLACKIKLKTYDDTAQAGDDYEAIDKIL